MAVIALDTSHPLGSVSVARDGGVAATVTFGEDASHLAGIGPACGRALEDAGIAEIFDVFAGTQVETNSSLFGARGANIAARLPG